MTGLALKLFFSGILNRLLKAAGAAISWARRNPWPAVVIVLCVALAGTWWLDGRKIANLRADNASKQATIDKMDALGRQADKDWRAAEKSLATNVITIQKEKDDAIAHIVADRDAQLAELLRRPSRGSAPASASTVASNGPAIVGSTGAELFREDAEFLVREAARADTVRASLLACYAQYETARSTLASAVPLP